MSIITDLFVEAAKEAVPGLVKAAEHAAGQALGVGSQKKSCVQSAVSGLLACTAGFGAGVDTGTVLTAIGDHIDKVVAGFNTDGTFTKPGGGNGGRG